MASHFQRDSLPLDQLFEGKSHAESYAIYRPTYPASVYTAITEYCKKSADFTFNSALDIACGTGQSTIPLTQHFVKVCGIDVSANQIEQAKKQIEGKHMIEYTVNCAEDLGYIAPGTIDLITCAMSFHWFNQSKVFKESQRVLAPSGVLAVYGYGKANLSLESANQIVDKFYNGTLGPYWTPERKLVETHFKGVELPFDDFTRVDNLEIVRQMPLSSFIGYLNTWSAYRKFLKAHPDSHALEEVRHSLAEANRTSGGSVHEGNEEPLDVSWPLYLLMGRNL